MNSVVLAVILAVVSNAVVCYHQGHYHGHHHGHYPGQHHGHYHGHYHGQHYGQHHGHHYENHKRDSDDHQPWHNKPDEDLEPWKDKNGRSSSAESKESKESPEYDSNEWGHDNGNEDWWDMNSSPTPIREPSVQECMSSCHVPSDYAPVCGTDYVTYKNLDDLHCARQCGVDVSVRKLSKCTDNNINNGNSGWPWPPTEGPSTTGTDLWTSTPSTIGNDFWTRTPSTSGNDIWTRAPSTNSNNFWTRTPSTNGNDFWTRAPSTNSNSFWTKLTPKTPTGDDFWTRRPPWGPSTKANIDWTTSPNDLRSIESCITSCAKSTTKSPVCGSNKIIYNNLEHLHCAQLCGVDVTEQRLSQCPTGNNNGNGNPIPTTPAGDSRTTVRPELEACIRSCPATSEYNPVCGTDGVTYNNLGQLWCAKQCGINVDLHRSSPCPATSSAQPPTGSTTQSTEVAACIRACPVTSEYNPICGTDGVTYTNSGRLECAKYCGVDVAVHRNSACPTTLPPPELDTDPSSMPLEQNNNPIETTPSANSGGFTISADLLASIFTVTPPTAAPDEDIDPRFNNNRRNNSTDNTSIKYPE